MLAVRTTALVVLAGLAWSVSARAQDPANLATAREVAVEGLLAFDSGRYQDAADQLGRAYAVVRVPTVGLYRARALIHLGRWVEAAELLLEITRLRPAEANTSQLAAQQEAEEERRRLLPRIPKLVVQLASPAGTSATVEVNGVVVPAALLGVARRVDPGTCQATVRADQKSVTEEVVLREGETKTISLTIESPEGGSPSPSTPRPLPAVPPPPLSPRAGAAHRIAGWTSLSLGGAALALGGISALLANQKRAELDQGGCYSSHCYLDQSGDVDHYNTFRLLSGVGLVSGGLGVAGGLLLLVSAPKPQLLSPKASVAPWLGPQAAGIQGRF